MYFLHSLIKLCSMKHLKCISKNEKNLIRLYFSMARLDKTFWVNLWNIHFFLIDSIYLFTPLLFNDLDYIVLNILFLLWDCFVQSIWIILCLILFTIKCLCFIFRFTIDSYQAFSQIKQRNQLLQDIFCRLFIKCVLVKK